MSSIAVQVEAVTHRYGSTLALDSVDISLGSGIVGLLGPNGAGKTTLLRMAATTLAPTSGSLRILGEDPRERDGRVSIRRRLGYLPQEPGYHRSFTAFAFVDYVAILKEMTDRRSRHDEVRRVLHLVGLSSAMQTRVGALSGGMRRRVGIAQALLGRPELLVLDEPTAGLDPEQRLRFREVLTESAAAQGAAVVLSTHQTDDVAALCQRVVVLLAGRVHFDGSVSELADVAGGRVWHSRERHPGARLACVTATGTVRNIGEPPPGADLVEPTIEDGYLLLTNGSTWS